MECGVSLSAERIPLKFISADQFVTRCFCQGKPSTLNHAVRLTDTVRGITDLRFGG